MLTVVQGTAQDRYGWWLLNSRGEVVYGHDALLQVCAQAAWLLAARQRIGGAA